jgi:hypothetical protein
MARLFWMGYCSHSPLVLMRLAGSFAVLLSQEGALMGDKFGSFVASRAGCGRTAYMYSEFLVCDNSVKKYNEDDD